MGGTRRRESLPEKAEVPVRPRGIGAEAYGRQQCGAGSGVAQTETMNPRRALWVSASPTVRGDRDGGRARLPASRTTGGCVEGPAAARWDTGGRVPLRA